MWELIRLDEDTRVGLKDEISDPIRIGRERGKREKSLCLPSEDLSQEENLP